MQAQNTAESDQGLILGASTVRQVPQSDSYEIYVAARLFDEINAIRVTHGLEQLENDTLLSTVAYRHSDELSHLPYTALNKQHKKTSTYIPTITHTGNTFGASHRERLETYSITVATSGENIIAQPLVDSMVIKNDHIVSEDFLPLDMVISESVQSWMASPKHRANILLSDYTHTGIGAVVIDQHIIITQVFVQQL